MLVTDMRAAAVGISHSPIKGRVFPRDPEAEVQHDEALAKMSAWIEAFDPDLVVIFGPDHYRGFFNDLMPSFCVGIKAESIGDWLSPAGPVNVPEETALECVRYLLREEIDTAFSYRMRFDHGLAQPLGWLGIGLERRPILPIFINCWAKPLPSYERVRKFGAAMGRFMQGRKERVLFIGSGGLSHDPPVPKMATALPEVREKITVRRHLSEQELRDVEDMVTREAHAMIDGKSSYLPPNEEWDRSFIKILESQRLEDVDGFGDEIEQVAGGGAHEIRTWVAAFAAVQAAEGEYKSDVLYQRSVPEWLTGMGIMRAVPA